MPAHYEQSWANSCIPACIVIAERWRGRSADEEALHAGATRDGHALDLATSLPGARRLRAAQTEDLAVALAQDCVAIVTVSGPAWTSWVAASNLRFRSRHGRLCAPGTFGGPLHALVLLGRKPGLFLVLDPWFPANAQPIEVDDDSFERVWAGEAIVVARDPA